MRNTQLEQGLHVRAKQKKTCVIRVLLMRQKGLCETQLEQGLHVRAKQKRTCVIRVLLMRQKGLFDTQLEQGLHMSNKWRVCYLSAHCVCSTRKRKTLCVNRGRTYVHANQVCVLFTCAFVGTWLQGPYTFTTPAF